MNNTNTMNHLEAEPIGVSDNIFSVSFWVKTSKTDSQVFLADPKMTIGILATADAITVCPTSHKMFTKSNFVMGKWNHIVGIRNGDNYSLYINGVAASETVSSNYFTHNVQKLWLLHRSSNSTGGPSDAEMSDVRIYATALSADDVAELYNTAAVTDKQGNFLCYEAIEDGAASITKTGIAKFNIDERDRGSGVTIYSTVQPNLLLGTRRDNVRYEVTGATTEIGLRLTPAVQLQINKKYTFSAMIRGFANMGLYTINSGGSAASPNERFDYISKSEMSAQDFKLFSVTFKVTKDVASNTPNISLHKIRSGKHTSG